MVLINANYLKNIAQPFNFALIARWQLPYLFFPFSLDGV
jgi:hypothetical protein